MRNVQMHENSFIWLKEKEKNQKTRKEIFNNIFSLFDSHSFNVIKAKNVCNQKENLLFNSL